MTRIRTIKPEFPQSESMGRMTRDARLLFVLLWTLADDEGRLRGSSRFLSGQLFPYDDDARDSIDSWIDELIAEECITRYSVGGSQFIQIQEWKRHQKIDRPSKSRFPEPPQVQKEDAREPSMHTREPSRGLDEPSMHTREPSRGLDEPSMRTREASLLDQDQDQDQDQDHGPRTMDLLSASALSTVADEAATVTAEPKQERSEFNFLLAGNKTWNLPRERLEDFVATFGDRIDVYVELKKAALWLKSNAEKRPRKKCDRFVLNWLCRADEDARRRPGGRARDAPRASLTVADIFGEGSSDDES